MIAAHAVLLAGLLAGSPGSAWPDLSRRLEAAGLPLFRDARRGDLYYYLPGDLAVAHDAAGRPDLRLLQVRYTGTASAGDQGTTLLRSQLSFRVIHAAPAAGVLEGARRALQRGSRGRVELRPFPIRRLETVLVYALSTAGDDAPGPAPLPGGELSPGGEETPTAGGFWSERVYTIGLDAAAAQVLWRAFHEGGVALSLGWAFYGLAAAPSDDLARITGSPELVAALRARGEAGRPSARRPGGGDAEGAEVLVAAGATAVAADAQRWPELFRRVDLGEQAPPGYAALGVYCYDFRDGLRHDLYEKRVEVAATSVGGGEVALEAAFGRHAPDLYVRHLRFPVAVRLDRPYRYRVKEVLPDGSSRSTPWATASWSGPLDVTSPPESRPPDPVPSPEVLDANR